MYLCTTGRSDELLLYYKLNNRLDEIKKEIDQFDPDAYDLVFEMFYAITDSKEAYRLTMEYFKQIPMMISL